MQWSILEHCSEVRTPAEEELMSWHLSILRQHYEGEVRVLRIGYPWLQVLTQCRLRQLWVALLRQHEVIEVIKPLDSIITTKDVQSILHYLASMTESTGWSFQVADLLLLAWWDVLDLRVCDWHSLVFGLNSAPKIFIYLKLVKVTSWISSASTEKIDWISMGQQHMWISGWWNEHTWQVNQGPCLRRKVKVVKVIELACSIMTPKQVHTILQNRGRSSIPALRPDAITPDLRPCARLKVKLV